MNTRTLHLLDVEYLGCGPVFSAGGGPDAVDRTVYLDYGLAA